MLKALGANTNPGEIAHAASCGLLLGLMPKNNILWYLILIFILFMRINKPAYALLVLAGAAIAPFFDGVLDAVGYWFLTIPALSGAFGALLDVPFVAFTRFNNSIVMGSLLCALVAYIPVYVCMRVLIALWRRFLVPVLRNNFVSKVLGKLPLISKAADLLGDE
ncbi:MAG: TIGR03546 family protein [Treponema sp.]|nr:TIGR03546 family protein [Treponema sp.]